MREVVLVAISNGFSVCLVTRRDNGELSGGKREIKKEWMTADSGEPSSSPALWSVHRSRCAWASVAAHEPQISPSQLTTFAAPNPRLSPFESHEFRRWSKPRLSPRYARPGICFLSDSFARSALRFRSPRRMGTVLRFRGGCKSPQPSRNLAGRRRLRPRDFACKTCAP